MSAVHLVFEGVVDRVVYGNIRSEYGIDDAVVAECLICVKGLYERAVESPLRRLDVYRCGPPAESA